MPKPIALLLCGLGAVVLVGVLRLSARGGESRGWTRAQGRVIVSHVEEIPGPSEEGGPRFRPVVRYAYEVGGRSYESERVSLASPPGSPAPDRAEAERQVARFPAGREVEVWHDPRDPREAVLVRGVPRAQILAGVLFGLALLGGGIFGLAR